MKIRWKINNGCKRKIQKFQKMFWKLSTMRSRSNSPIAHQIKKYWHGRRNLMRKGAHLRTQYFSLKLEKGIFCAPKFWPLLSNCAPNFLQVPPPLENMHLMQIGCDLKREREFYTSLFCGLLMYNHLAMLAKLSREVGLAASLKI